MARKNPEASGNTSSFKSDFALLLEGGFIAVNQLDEENAWRLFASAQVLEPNHSGPLMGFGNIHLNKMEAEEAVRIFSAIVEQEPDNEMAKAFLGVACVITKKDLVRGEKLLKGAAECKTIPSVKQLGELWLNALDKIIKKQPARPFAAH